jgi:hypothetical protein
VFTLKQLGRKLVRDLKSSSESVILLYLFLKPSGMITAMKRICGTD